MIPLNQILDGVTSLPPTPRILPKLQRLLRDADSGMHDIISLLKVDAPMTAQIVRLSNSAYYNSGTAAQSLEDAINRLGFREVYRVTSVAAAQQVLGEEMPAYRMRKGELLEASINCAVLMAELTSRSRRCDLDSAYTAGLLHSIGKVIINRYFVKHGIEIYGSGNETMESGLERVLLGFDYAEVGGAILTRWNFPEEILMPVKFHLRPKEAPKFMPVACLLSLAAKAAPSLATDDPRLPANIDPDVLEAAGITEDDLADAIEDARMGIEEVESMIR